MASRTATALLLVSALTITGGCVPSKHPLSNEKTSQVDPRLVGRWVIEGDKGSTFDIRQVDGQNGLEAQGTDEETGETIYATTIGDLHYLSVPSKNEETGQHEYEILLYEFVDDDTLRIYPLKPEAVLKAIVDGELTGLIETERVGFSTTQTRQSAQMITDSRYYLVLYLKKHGKDCFLSADDFDITYVRQPN